jgi:lambda family phage portal protein
VVTVNPLHWLARQLFTLEPSSATAAPPQRRYNRRSVGRRNLYAGVVDRFSASWTTEPQSIDHLIETQLRILRARSRERCQADPYASQFLAINRRNIVGPDGVRLQSQPLNRDNQIDRPAARAIEEAWADWGRPENCDPSGIRDLVDQQETVINQMGEDGEYLGQIVTGPAAGKFQLGIRPLDPELLPVEHSPRGQTPEGNTVRFGIEYNPWGRPVAYWLRQGSHGALPTYASSYYGQTLHRFDASQIIHIFDPLRAGQKRGLPATATALMRLRMVGAYEDAALMNARLGATKVGHYYSETGERYEGDGEDLAGNLLEDLEPGETRNLPAGVRFEGFDPSYPNGEFSPFTKRALQGVSAGLDVSYPSLARDLEGVNFSSIRAAVLEDREKFKTWQRILVSKFLRRLWPLWLERALLLELIRVGPTALDPTRLDKYERSAWVPRRWSWVDPQKDTMSVLAQLDRGLLAPSQASAELGRDYQKTLEQIARDQKLVDDLGVRLAPPGTQPALFATATEGGGAE